jgi:hypothetical protein
MIYSIEYLTEHCNQQLHPVIEIATPLRFAEGLAMTPLFLTIRAQIAFRRKARLLTSGLT